MTAKYFCWVANVCSILEIKMWTCVCNLSATWCVQLDHNLKNVSPPYFSHENAQDSAWTIGWRKEQSRTGESRHYIWLPVDGEVKFRMVVQGHSVSHLDPSLNTQANFQHPFKLSSSYHLIKGSEVYTDLRSPLIHYYKSNTLRSASLSLIHTFHWGAYSWCTVKSTFTPGNPTV